MSQPPWVTGLSPLKRAYLAIDQLQARVEALERGRTEPIAIIGIGCRFPGGVDTPDDFWRLLHDGVDATGELPERRREPARASAARLDDVGPVPTRGGFLSQVDQFDAEFFGISPREALSLDPQHRLLLEVSWEALERAGHAHNRLASNQTGVFIGITSHDYAQLQGLSSGVETFDAYHITGNALNAAAGRLSYVFGFQGPCLAVDTACSSSLVAVHLACRSLANRECSLALAGGVNLILSPVASVALTRARVLSADGRCKAFDASADGMGRSEGCGVVVLKRLSEAVRDRDHMIAVIAGSAINQDGASSGLTVPNGPAQETLIRQALTSAGVSPEHVDYVEAHGTGTALGDPVEFAALASVFTAGRSIEHPLYLGSVKSNIGHSEAAAGIAGLIKTALSLLHREIPRHLHFTRPNSHIRWAGVPISIASAPVSWPQRRTPRAAGISSFGFTGTNAHVVLQEAPSGSPDDVPRSQGRPRHVLVLSARTLAALKTLATRYVVALRDATGAVAEDICYSASIGRSHFEYRLAACMPGAAELAETLAGFANERTTRVRSGHAERPPRLAWAFAADRGQSLAVADAIRVSEPRFEESLGQCDALVRPYLGQALSDLLRRDAEGRLSQSQRQVALFALQWAFAQLWRSWGLQPTAVVGAGVGEFTAATIAGVLQLDDAVTLLVDRVRLVNGGASPDVLFSPPQVCLLDSRGCSLSNALVAERLTDAFERSGSVDIVESPVDGCDRVLEVGPTDRTSCEFLLELLAELYVHGTDVDWVGFWRNRPTRRVPLPTYPFDRQRYWISEVNRREAPLIRASPPDHGHPLLGDALQLAGTDERRFESRIRADAPEFLKDHRVFGETVFPAAGYIELALAALARTTPSAVTEVRDLTFHRRLVLASDQDTTIQIVLRPRGARTRQFEVFGKAHDEWLLHCSGALEPCDEDCSSTASAELSSLQSRITEPAEPQTLYQECLERGIELGPCFRALTCVVRRDGEALALVELPADLTSSAGRFSFHPVLLDGCFQALGAATPANGRDYVYLPLTLDRVRVMERPPERLYSHACIRPAETSDPRHLIIDFTVFADDGRRVAVIEGLHLQRASMRHDWLYEIAWEAQPAVRGLQDIDRVVLARTAREDARRSCPAPLAEPERTAYQRVARAIEELSTEYIVEGLRTLGCSFTPGQQLTTPGLAADLQIVGRHHKQLNRFLRILAEDGWMQPNGDSWQVIASPPVTNAAERARVLEHEFPAAHHELQILQRCGSRLADVFRGHCDPLELLFPDAPAVSAAALYQDSEGARAANAVVERIFSSYREHLPPARRLRVLEIGAGTGGTTASLLPHLAGRNVDYVFTDVSAAFVTRARRRFSSHSFLDFRTFDLETSPIAQGFEAGTYDVVVAANVFHATRDLRQSLAHAHELLAPGGLLVLVEGVAPLRFIDLIFGMTDGWWRFADADLRANHPLLSTSQWTALLDNSGFEENSVVTPKGAPGVFENQAILVATKRAPKFVAPRPPELWVLFADSRGVGQRIEGQLVARGARCVVVLPGLNYQAGPGHRFSIDPHNPAHYQRLLHDAATVLRAPVRGIVHLWALDAVAASSATSARTAAALQCRSMLHVVQAAAQIGAALPPRVMLVTSGAQAAGGPQPLDGIFQASLWGIGKAIALEHPEFRCIRLDLDPADRDPTSLADAVAYELFAAGAEDEIAYRGEQRLVARLARHSPATRDQAMLRFREDATYLITGGLTGLGMRVARWMAARGARHLALMSRSEPDGTSRAELEALGDQCDTATHYRGDVANVDDLKQVLDAISGSSRPLRGIIHSAGILADGSLVHQDWERFERVLRPKVDGAWNLHASTVDQPLDFFVLFSSAASVLGSPAQSNHCAANAFLDALAHYRHAQGLRACSINWGPWSEIGAAAGAKVSTRLATHGMGAMTPTQGLSILEYSMTGSTTQLAAIPIEWASLTSRFAQGTEPRFFSRIAAAERARLSPTVAVSAGEPTPLLRADAPVAERTAWLQDYLTERISGVLQVSITQISLTKPLNHLGLDSLMAIEIRNRITTDLGLDVPVVALLDGASIAALAGKLAQTTILSPHARTRSLPPEISPDVASRLLSRLNDLTVEQVDALLGVASPAALYPPAPPVVEGGGARRGE